MTTVDTQSSVGVLVDEAVYILREVAACFERPTILFSGGKDSAVLLRCAQLAFAPARIPFSVLHVDTGHNFEEVISFRDVCVKQLGVQLHVASVQTLIDEGRLAETPGHGRNRLQTVALLEAIKTHRFDALVGGGRRDEEKARAKERVFSVRNEFGQWDPRAQRPELWDLYNPHLGQGEHMRVFPLSNWTELDVWRFIAADKLPLPSLYYAHEREVFDRDSMLLAVTPWTQPEAGESPRYDTIRYRTVGDATCTGAVLSTATDAEAVIEEISVSRLTERGATRADDRFSESAMEDRKREGYF